MPYYRQLGEIPRKRHTQFRQPDGSLYAEELMGVEGFSSDASLLYHRNLPTAIVSSEVFDAPDLVAPAQPPAQAAALQDPQARRGRRPGPRAPAPARQRRRPDVLRRRRPAVAALPQRDRRRVRVRRERLSGRRDRVRCADGRHRRLRRHPHVDDASLGARRASCGCWSSRRRGTSARRAATCRRRGSSSSTRPTASATCAGRWSRCTAEGEDVEVLVQHRGRARHAWTRYRYAHHPFDVVGWDGCLYPYVFSINDFEPITGRLHQPPPVHQTFEGPNFVICSFVPAAVRLPPRGHPGALQPRQRRLRRGHLLHRRRLHVPQGRGHRAGVDLAAPVRVHPRPAAGLGRGVDRQGAPPTSWPSWSTRSGRWSCCEPALACEDASYAWTWSGRSVPRDGRDATDGDGDGDGLDSTTG